MNAEIEKKKGEFVRDVTSVVHMAKSEVERRLNEILDKHFIAKEEEIPMGVSQWLNHGKKYGYADFFYSKQDLLDILDKHLKTSTYDGKEALVFKTTIEEIRDKINEK